MTAVWQQLVVSLGQRDPAPFEAICTEAGACAVTLTDAGDDPVLEPAPGETPLWRETRLTALFAGDAELAPVLDTIGAFAGTKLPFEVELLADRAWEREWLREFRPARFGDTLWVCPNGTTSGDPAAIELTLDPGLAFGTGSHATTALCLEWLDEVSLDGLSVLDYGTGSGILAIAALLLGAQCAVATDIDPQSLRASRRNAEVNGVTDRLSIVGIDAVPPRPFDLVVANILATTLSELAETLAASTGSGGAIALSGILVDQAPELVALYDQWFALEPVRQRDGWALITGRRL